MSISIKTRQWLWFIALWFGGLFAMFALSYPLKMLIKMAS